MKEETTRLPKGTKVRVLRFDSNYTFKKRRLGWAGSMEDFIGEICIIDHPIHNSDGEICGYEICKFRGSVGWSWPTSHILVNDSLCKIDIFKNTLKKNMSNLIDIL